MRAFAVCAVATLLLCVVRPALCQQDADSSARVSEFADWYVKVCGVGTLRLTTEPRVSGCMPMV